MPTVGRPLLLESLLARWTTAAAAARDVADVRVYVLLDAATSAAAVATANVVARWPIASVLLPDELPPDLDVARLAASLSAPARRSIHLAAVYHQLMETAFVLHGRPLAVFWEDDLEPSPDTVVYFAAAARALDADPTLWCASAWSDNSFPATASDDRALLRGEVCEWASDAR